jgi:hypothetical protein
MAQDEIVSKMTSMGRFTDSYVADLVEGDRYIINPNAPLPTVTADYAVQWIEDNKIVSTVLFPESGLVDDDKFRWSFFVRKDPLHSTPLFTGEPGMNFMECVTAMIEMEEL